MASRASAPTQRRFFAAAVLCGSFLLLFPCGGTLSAKSSGAPAATAQAIVVAQQTCKDGRPVPADGACMKVCPHGSEYPEAMSCPSSTPSGSQTCKDGQPVPSDGICMQTCSDGSKVPETSTCTESTTPPSNETCRDGQPVPSDGVCM